MISLIQQWAEVDEIDNINMQLELMQKDVTNDMQLEL